MSTRGPDTGVWFFPDRPAPDLVEAVGLAEDLGFQEVWLGDEGPAREPFSVLAAAAAATSTIRLAVGVTNPYVRHPGLAATTMLTVSELSGGRAILGVGAGGALSLAPFDLEATRPVAAVRRFIEVAAAARDHTATPGYRPSDLSVGATGVALPIFVGARGPRLNTLASELADGAFVAGMPPFRYEEIIGWARSVRPISIALYPSVAFGADAREDHRPEMVWGLLDSPPEVRARLGVGDAAVRQAADALRGGDERPARNLVTDDIIEELMLVGAPADVGRTLASLARAHEPASVGLAIIQRDLEQGLGDAAAAFAVMRRELGVD